MTLTNLKYAYKKALIDDETMDKEDFDQYADEIDETTTLNEFLDVVRLWSHEAPTKGAATVVLERILQEPEKTKLVKPTNLASEEEIAKLETIYHEIDTECISETDTVKMDSVRKVLVKYGAIEEDLF